MSDDIPPNSSASYPATPQASRLLLQELIERQISVNEVGNAAGIRPCFVRVILHNKARISAHTGVRLALALGRDHRHFLLAQARHDACQVARILVPVEGQIRRAPVVCEVPPPNAPTLKALLNYELQRRRITCSLAARMAGLTWRTIHSLITTSNPNNTYAAVRLAQVFGLPLDHFTLAEAARRADMALADIATLPRAEERPRPARPDGGMRKSTIRVLYFA